MQWINYYKRKIKHWWHHFDLVSEALTTNNKVEKGNLNEQPARMAPKVMHGKKDWQKVETKILKKIGEKQGGNFTRTTSVGGNNMVLAYTDYHILHQFNNIGRVTYAVKCQLLLLITSFTNQCWCCRY